MKDHSNDDRVDSNRDTFVKAVSEYEGLDCGKSSI